MTRVLVCGSRDFIDKEFLDKTLDELNAEHKFVAVIEGEAPGADTLARRWAQTRGIDVDRYPAHWKRFGRGAGPIRNRQMLDEGKPDLIVAFPRTTLEHTKGTANMVNQATELGFTVLVFEGG